MKVVENENDSVSRPPRINVNVPKVSKPFFSRRDIFIFAGAALFATVVGFIGVRHKLIDSTNRLVKQEVRAAVNWFVGGHVFGGLTFEGNVQSWGARNDFVVRGNVRSAQNNTEPLVVIFTPNSSAQSGFELRRIDVGNRTQEFTRGEFRKVLSQEP